MVSRDAGASEPIQLRTVPDRALATPHRGRDAYSGLGRLEL